VDRLLHTVHAIDHLGHAESEAMLEYSFTF